MSFGGHLLFEVEAFRAEDFASAEGARSLTPECDDLAGFLTSASFDWFIRTGAHGEWEARN